jgi:hypothetical protein
MLKGTDFVDYILYIEQKKINSPQKKKPEFFIMNIDYT